MSNEIEQKAQKPAMNVRERFAAIWGPARRIVLGAILVLLVVAGLYISRGAPPGQPRQALPQPPPARLPAIIPPSSPANEALQKELAGAAAEMAAMREEIARLKTAESEKAAAPPEPAPANTAAPDPAEQPEHHLLEILSSVERIGGEVRALSSRLTALETAQAENTADAEKRVDRMAYMLGLRELERALAHSGPFTMELESLARLLAPDDPVIAELRLYAANGVPSRAQLTSRFDAMAAAMVRADAAQAATGWAGRAYQFIQSLILIRPLGEREGDGAPERIARAQMRLEEGDLHAAVAEIKAVEHKAPEGMGWLMDAEKRLAAEQALARLSPRLTTHLGGAAVTTPSPAAGE